MKNVFTILLLTFFILYALSAQTIESGGISYSITSTELPYTVGVTSKIPKYEGDIVIPSSIEDGGITYTVASIGVFAFLNCTDLRSVLMPVSLTSIGNNAFRGCTGITAIEIPNSVTSIGASTFYGCSNLAAINVVTDNIFFSSLNGVLFNKDMTTLFRCPEGKLSVEIPDFVTHIGESAFINCAGLTSVEIPVLVTSIGNSAFRGCTGLASVEFPGSVLSIGDNAFRDCNGLTSVVSHALIPPSAGAEVFNNVSKTIPLNVPAESIDAYKSASQWKDFTNIVAIIATKTGFGALTEVSIYPNPVRDMLTINGIINDSHISVYNINGFLISTIKAQNETESFDFSTFASGVYFVEVNQKGHKSLAKIVKK